ncbi:MAG: LytTR family transcriptional regulator DNA-binding domain-containing protein [Bacteroidota bacterium]
MNQQNINLWIRYLFPFFLAGFLGMLIYMMAQFREPPGFSWYILVWFFLSIFVLWEMGWWVSRKLDPLFPWRKGTFKRLVLQLLATNILGTLIFTFLFILLNWYENAIRGHDNPLGFLHLLVTISQAALFIQIINSIQISYQLLENWQAIQLEAEQEKKTQVIHRLKALQSQIDPLYLNNNLSPLKSLFLESPDKANAYLKDLSEEYQIHQNQLANTLTKVQQSLSSPTEKSSAPTSTPQKPTYKTRFLVRSGTRYTLVPLKDIVTFYKDDLVLLFTQQGKKYVVDASLEELYQQLPPNDFFRINRQCILNVHFLEEMKMEGHQMLLSLRIPFPKSLAVSQRNVSAFKRWVREELS